MFSSNSKRPIITPFCRNMIHHSKYTQILPNLTEIIRNWVIEQYIIIWLSMLQYVLNSGNIQTEIRHIIHKRRMYSKIGCRIEYPTWINGIKRSVRGTYQMNMINSRYEKFIYFWFHLRQCGTEMVR